MRAVLKRAQRLINRWEDKKNLIHVEKHADIVLKRILKMQFTRKQAKFHFLEY